MFLEDRPAGWSALSSQSLDPTHMEDQADGTDRMRPSEGEWAEVSAPVAGEQLTVASRPAPVHDTGRRSGVIGLGAGNRRPVGR